MGLPSCRREFVGPIQGGAEGAGQRPVEERRYLHQYRHASGDGSV